MTEGELEIPKMVGMVDVGPEAPSLFSNTFICVLAEPFGVCGGVSVVGTDVVTCGRSRFGTSDSSPMCSCVLVFPSPAFLGVAATASLILSKKILKLAPLALLVWLLRESEFLSIFAYQKGKDAGLHCVVRQYG